MWAVETQNLTKDYPVGFWRKNSRRALKDLSLRVEAGETFGLLGPNGAGKSTTLKILLRLIFPTSGQARVLGRNLQDASARARIGYLPENPYFYDHLTAREFLQYAGELFNLPAAHRRSRAETLLDRTGLTSVQNLPLRKFSKGMVQRLGLAQALINDPDLVILDEPMSGLDPLGRRDVRDLILQLRQAGKTVVFSTHILSDAESVCDRVAILHQGQLQACGALPGILNVEVATTEILLQDPRPELLQELRSCVHIMVRTGSRVRLEVPTEVDVNAILHRVLLGKAKIVSVNPIKKSLEDYFLAQVQLADARSETGNLKSETESSIRVTGDSKRETGNACLVGSVIGTEAQTAATAPDRDQRPVRGSNLQFPLWNSLRRVRTIALHTFKESVRDKALYNLILFAFLLTGAAVLVGSISVGIEQMILVNLGLSSISIFGLLMAIFIGIGLVWKEIDRRTLYNILSKPVARPEFILGKYFGLLLTIVINTTIMTAGLYLTLFLEKRSLEHSDWAPLVAAYFILEQLALVIGLALLFSSISTPILSAVFTFALYVIGHFLTDVRFFGQQTGSAVMVKVTSLLYYVLPNFADFEFIGGAAHGQLPPAYLVAGNSLYALLYASILLAAAVLIFEEREFR